MKNTIDGRWTLKEQRNAIQFKENLSFLEMMSVSGAEETALSDDKGNTFPLNVITFREWKQSRPCPELFMESVSSRQDIPSVIAKHAANGRGFICAEDAYVEGHTTIVVCFR